MTANTPDREQRANRQHLIDLLRRKAKYSGVWFAEHLETAANLLADTELSRSEEGQRVRRAIRTWVSDQDDSDADISPLQYVLNREDTLADAICAALASDRRAQGDGEYVLVPRTPSKAMLEAIDDTADDKFVARGRAVEVWSAMISAVDTPVV